jgi:hypothetical protein
MPDSVVVEPAAVVEPPAVVAEPPTVVAESQAALSESAVIVETVVVEEPVVTVPTVISTKEAPDPSVVDLVNQAMVDGDDFEIATNYPVSWETKGKQAPESSPRRFADPRHHARRLGEVPLEEGKSLGTVAETITKGSVSPHRRNLVKDPVVDFRKGERSSLRRQLPPSEA